MVKFVESDSSGLPLKRKQVSQACLSCRRRKKRCVHEGQYSSEGTAQLQDSVSPPRPGQHPVSLATTVSKISPANSWPSESPRSQENRTSRFVGDLNPEHLLIEATSPHSSRDLSVRGGIGVWQIKRGETSNATLPPSAQPGPNQTLNEILVSHAKSRCLPCVPPPATWTALSQIYIERLDPLFPVVSNYTAELPDNSVSAIVVKQAICLAASADPDAAAHLRLRPHGPVVSRYEFCGTLSAAIQGTLDAGLITDRIWLIRILLLFSMHVQPSSSEEADLPTSVFAKAVHHMHTLGLHIGFSKEDADYEQIQTLFCCIWALDRLNAALYGRACLIHERDIGWDFNECIEQQPPPFRLYLMVTQLLNQVIGLYRPGKNPIEEPMVIDLPISEQLILDADAIKVASPLLATIEILYHSVSILSCRYPPGGSPGSTVLPPRGTNSRRSLSADRVTDIIQEEFPGQISYMPLIPYAVSLSLSVSYRKMRYSSVPMFRLRGRRAFAANTALLKKLGDTFFTAKTMATMAEQVLQEMDKAVVSITQETSTVDNSTPEKEKPQSEAQPSTEPMNMNPAARSFRANPLVHDNGMNGTSIFFAAPELDVFGHFDPSFNLGAVDAALEANLDFGTSSNWYDWQQTWG
ncbi:uncharacterized protein BCR38DRAFT_334546 [Pseudomassariella vexata]|uniref:Xylanolytic transcriptional activator regulatory domain-containing protein n=1 Tax=Pseudomassariella vexata TaxID=1141098 RepID=A0A1Y2E9G2_9PEZI|nr:uncharacterized protein BCR38DRAFT_334546 [Pseudomassariella vexata]ORY68210.1 hypothetical protein BCR38DRAFT_334546 [Pseudomassariella vexata]